MNDDIAAIRITALQCQVADLAMAFFEVTPAAAKAEVAMHAALAYLVGVVGTHPELVNPALSAMCAASEEIGNTPAQPSNSL